MDKDNEILKLRKEIERLRKSVKKQRYGLVWMDIPEAFEDDVENKLPILKEVPELAIKNNDGRPTHILIEGDNYHALTCLNYTHRGKIDVIYIDPPYNTGSDGFRYKDKRIIDKFPDGTEVPIDHPFRHSYWLSFMRKRIGLAKDLLKDTGVIFISIDDNEYSQLKMLCDEIFTEENFLTSIVLKNKAGAGAKPKALIEVHEYILMYAKNSSFIKSISIPYDESNAKLFTKKDKHFSIRGPYGTWALGTTSMADRPNLRYPINYNGEKIWPEKQWLWSQERVEEAIRNDEIVFNKMKNGKWSVRFKQYLRDKNGNLRNSTPTTLFEGPYTHEGTKELMDILGSRSFMFPKPVNLIKKLLKFNYNSNENKNPIVLDFFAGSGTTAQAIMELNKTNGANGQFILITNNENKIMEEVCYPRIKKIMKGYKDKMGEKIEGLGSSLKYYKTKFIGKNNILNATDSDKIELALNAGELLAIAENTLESIKQTKYYQLFEDETKKTLTAIYFREELDKFEEFLEIVEKTKTKTTVYVFSWGDEEFGDEFDHMKNVRVKTIPLPILEIYKNIYNIGGYNV